MHLATPRIGSRMTRIATTLGLIAGVLVLAAPAAQAVQVASVSVGAVHACVKTVAGDAKCWGYNDVGMVGDGTRIDRRVPTDVNGLGGGVQDVQAVWDHSCAITTAGIVKCWGHNGDGELGDGTLLKSLVPVKVIGPWNDGTAQQVSLGFDSGCALTGPGGIVCWGYNGNGQLGDGTRTTRKHPVDVFGLSSGIKQISAGWDHTCALTTGGAVECWGQNKHGEVGDGSRSDRLKPVPVTGLSSGVAQVSAGYDQTCALLTGGTVKCWGNNATGELGNGTTTSSNVPVTVSGLSGVDSISAGYNHTCAVTTSGAAKCWGANESGELGDGTTHSRTKPVTVYHAGSGVAQISAGGFKKKGMTCLVTTAGAVQCFGSNNGVHNLAPIDSHGGQLGDGTTIQRHIPITVRTLTGASPANYRPDLLISKHAGGGYAGNHIYNTSGANQTKATAMAPGGARHFFVRVQNDSHVADSFFLVGSRSGHGFVISYSSGGKNIRSSVTSGQYWVSVPAGATRTVVVTVSAKNSTPHGVSSSLKVVVRSAGDSAKADAVKGVFKTL
jgi:alpha-tubulin suppressor-like RCC1 family protein